VTIEAISHEELKRVLDYNFITGVFRWKPRHELNVKPRYKLNVRTWSIAGTLNADGYITIKIFGKRYLAHRLAWLYMTGEWPRVVMDHINRRQTDNSWINLREATLSQNQCNRGLGKSNTSGYKGVRWNANNKKWYARICLNRKYHDLGAFDTAENAHAAYVAAAIVLHGEFANPGFPA
jgi:hypothetical protein